MLKIAHRGSHIVHPENTLSAIEQAINLKADAIEIDVRVCKSGEFVLHHDASFKRLTGFNQKIDKTDLSVIKNLRFLKSPSEKVAELSEVLDLIKGKAQLNIEFKALKNSMLGSLRALSLQLKDMNLEDQVWASTFNPLLIKKLQNILDIKTAFLFDHVKFIPLIVTELYKIDYWHPNFQLVDEKLMEVAKLRNKKVFPWTVNDVTEVQRLKDLGVSGIITDKLEIL